MIKRLHKHIISLRRYLTWPERASFIVMSTIMVCMMVADIIRACDPSQMQVGWAFIAVAQGAIALWLGALAYRPFPEKQRRIIATAMLLGMVLEEDNSYADYQPRYWADNPATRDVTDLQSWVCTPSRVYGRTPYDVAMQWLYNFNNKRG